MTESDKSVLLSIIRRMHSERELAPLMNLLKQEIKELIRADLVSVFGFDREACELRSFITIDNQEIRFDARLGVAGAVAMSGETLNIEDAPNHPLFFTVVDSQTGYRTETVLAVPIKNVRGEVIGVCEGINKRGWDLSRRTTWKSSEAFAGARRQCDRNRAAHRYALKEGAAQGKRA